MFTPFIQHRNLQSPLTLRPLAIAGLVTAAGLMMAACSPQPPASATVAVAAPVTAIAAAFSAAPTALPPTFGDPSLPTASEVFGGKVQEGSEQPAGF